MDLSALIFVALAVAWAVYLVPKALRQHEAGESQRAVEGFSDRLRVLARREPVDSRTAHLVVPGQRAAEVEAGPDVRPDRAPLRTHSSSSAGSARSTSPSRSIRSAAARRRRVLGVLLALLVVVAVLAATGVVGWSVVAAPGLLVLAWLVACRLMVRAAAPASQAASRPSPPPADAPQPTADRVDAPADVRVEDLPPADDVTDEFAPVPSSAWSDEEGQPVELDPETGAPVSWDPVPVTLPTYVAKEPAARRTVRTIDLDSTGVWTSGPHAADSALAREADAAERAARREDAAAEADRRRASGS